jgi:hypothetical protein
MRSICCLLIGFLALSCSGTGIREKGLREDHSGIPGETEMEEFEAIENLAENPIDPKRATLEMFLSIPGFPPDLASRVIRARGENSSGTRWLAMLTPAERETLYRFDRFVMLPERRPTRIRTRVTRVHVGSPQSERLDVFLSVENERWKLRCRDRLTTLDHSVSPYISRMFLSSALNIGVGDFMPDYAMGLLFNGSPYYYPFTAGFPLRGNRWIAPVPSWYGEAIRGCAVEGWIDRFRGMLFAGRPRIYRGGSVEFDRCVYGGRGCFAVRHGEVGLTFTCVEHGHSGTTCAVDGRWRTGDMQTAIEVLAVGRGAGAGTGGISFRGDPIGAGLVVYHIPFGLRGRFGAVPGGRIKGDSWQRGIASVVSGSIRAWSNVRASFERFVTGNASARRTKEIVRTEVETRWRWASMKLSYRWRLYRDESGIPYPCDDPITADETEGMHFLFLGRHGAVSRLRLSVRLVSEERGEGYLVSSSARIGLFRHRLRCTFAGSLYRSRSGEPVLYMYEPVLEGSFPWVAVRGNGWRGVVLTDVKWGGLTVSCRVSSGSLRETELGFMVSFKR